MGHCCFDRCLNTVQAWQQGWLTLRQLTDDDLPLNTPRSYFIYSQARRGSVAALAPALSGASRPLGPATGSWRCRALLVERPAAAAAAGAERAPCSPRLGRVRCCPARPPAQSTARPLQPPLRPPQSLYSYAGLRIDLSHLGLGTQAIFVGYRQAKNFDAWVRRALEGPGRQGRRAARPDQAPGVGTAPLPRPRPAAAAPPAPPGLQC